MGFVRFVRLYIRKLYESSYFNTLMRIKPRFKKRRTNRTNGICNFFAFFHSPTRIRASRCILPSLLRRVFPGRGALAPAAPDGGEPSNTPGICQFYDSDYSPRLYLLPSPGAGGPKKAAPWAAPGPRREERSPQPAQSGQPTEGRGRAGRGRGRPGGTHRGFGAEGPGGSPLWCGGWAMGPPGAARGRPEDRVPEPSEPPIGRSEASGGPGRRRSDG